jgi:glutamine amidotransferase|tara:strand:- start:2180 stop:2836 length:657 start_codon:yes stop_codon:yes gene_type:complete
MTKITLIDYEMGNIFNVFKAFEMLGCDVVLTKNYNEILNADRLVLPGVGSFENGMNNLKKYHTDEIIKEYLVKDRPLLGICVGMQLMMTRSYENGVHNGLNLIKGDVVRFDHSVKNKNIKIPQIGWNHLNISEKHIDFDNKENNLITKNLKAKPYMYFLHSYYVKPKNKDISIAYTTYGKNTFCSIFKKNNIIGFQFHPERSADQGLILLKNFTKIKL